ncbi:MAG: alpha-mannosidase [Lachnospiraceae bacterium]|nr:alpha-mannosidase [Lachnospiraceae bacterium]
MHYTSRIIIDNKLNMLENMIYQDIHPVTNWETKELLYTEPLKYEALDDWHPISMGDHWKARFDHTRLFRTVITIPQSFAGRPAMLILDLGGEGQIRINGEIVSGITSYEQGSFLGIRLRTRVYIPEKYKPGDILSVEAECSLNFLEFSALKLRDYAEYTLKTAFMAVIDTDLERYCFDLRCAAEAMDTFANPLDTLQHSNARILNPTVHKIMLSLNNDSYMHDKIFRVCMDSVSLLDLEFGYERLRASIPAASKALCDGLAAIPHKANAMVKFVGQSHIDTAWLWPLKETVRKCAKTFSNVISLMEKYPEFIFAFSQPQLFAYTEEFYPELFEKVKARVLEGRIELVGNAWVEMDANVPSGEALVRQLLYGRQYFMDKFGKASRVFWMPDVFGYSWALPQIMKRSGIDYFFTSKLCNNDTNYFPHSLFMWQGVDGTRILSYLQRINYNGELNADTLSEIYHQFDQKDVCDTVLMTIGYGDGGGGPSYQMLENASRLKDFPGLPQSEFATSESFFTEAEKCQDKLPVWNDEMYYEFHRGTYTSQANTKKNNRKGELLLQRTEMACTMAHILLGHKYPAKMIGDIWKPLLTNQFHDILPGSSIHQVYEDCDIIYKKIFEDANTLYNEAITSLNASLALKENQIAVWNFLGWENSGITKGAVKGCFSSLIDAEGNTVNAIADQDGDMTVFTFNASAIPAMGVKIYTAVNTAPNHSTDISDIVTVVSGTDDTLIMENRYLRVTLNADGNIISLYDKENARETCSGETVSNLLTVFEDIPHGESAWNIDMEYMDHYWTLEKADSVEVAESDSVQAIVRTVRRFNESTITQDIVLAHDARRVDFVTHVDWQETQRMLKAAFYADILSPKATYEIQFGSIERPTHWNTSYDKARFEVCGHKWADLSEGLYGVSILNDCKYGYDIKDNCLRLTLLRSPVFPDPTGDKGIHNFTYSVYPHSGDWRIGSTVKEAYRLNIPLQTAGYDPLNGSTAVCSCSKLNAHVPYSFVSCSHPNVVIDTIKGAEDGNGIIVRVYESQGARCKAELKFGFAAKKVCECNLMEICEQDIPVTDNSFVFRIKPYEIKTFRIF